MFNIDVDEQLLEAMENWLLTEEESTDFNSAPVQCLKPNQNPQQLFSVQSRDRDIIVRLCNFTGRTPKVVRASDKTAHVVLCEMSNKGKILQLRNGLGNDPLSIISGAFDAVMHVAHKSKLDAVLFRFNVSRLKGKTEIVKRVLARMVRRQPKFEVFGQEIMTSKKIAVVVIKRRSIAIDKIKGITLDESLFTKVDSDLGVRYVSKETGESLTKDEAYAASIASEEEKNAEAEHRVAAKSRLTKEELLKTQATYNSDYVSHPEKINLKAEEDITDTQPKKQFNSLIDKPALERSTARSLNDWTNDVITRYGFMRVIFESEADAKYAVTEIVKVQDQYNPMTAEVIAASIKRLKEIMNEEVFENKITAIAMDRVDQQMPADIKAEMLRSHIIQIKSDAVRNLASGMFEAIASNMGEVMSKIDLDLPGAEGFVLGEYADNAYINMNNFLSDRKLEEYEGVADPEELVKMCDTLDNAFANYGVKLDPGTILYRGMDFRSQMWDTARKQKAFYFKNYVSTSLAPNIFGGWNTNVATAVAGVDTMAGSRGEGGANVAFSIAGAENIPVLPVGNKAFAYNECEILLPRGVVLSFDTVTRATTSTDSNESYYIEAHIMNKQELASLQEGEIFDGDALINEGVVKPVSSSEITFAGFLTEAAENKTKTEKASMRQLIADMIDVNDMPRKFRM